MGTFGLERPVQGKGNIAVAPVPYQGFRGPARLDASAGWGEKQQLALLTAQVHPPQ